MKKHSLILAFITILALALTSCSLQAVPPNGSQGPLPVGPQPGGPQPIGPQPAGPQPMGPQPGGPQPGGPPPGGPQPGQPQPGQPQPGQPQPGQPQPGQPPTPEQPPAPTQASGSSGSSSSSSSGSGCAGAPQIPYFNASSTSITAGQSVTLSWGNITNGSTGPLVGSTTIEPGLGEVGSGASSRTVKPSTTTTYTLTATGCGGTKTRQVTVTVGSGGGGGSSSSTTGVDLAVANIYPAPTGHIMVTIKNAGGTTINSSTKLTCTGKVSEKSGKYTVTGQAGPYTQTLTFNLKAGEKFDQDTQIARDPNIVSLTVSCSITPPSGDTKSSDDYMNDVKVK